MSYYKERRRAIHIIDTMLRDGKSVAEIEQRIGLMFGFGRKMITDRKKILTEVAELKKNENN